MIGIITVILDGSDDIYYSYLFDNIKPKKIKWKIYCFIRKKLTIKESPSRVMAWCINNNKLLDKSDID